MMEKSSQRKILTIISILIIIIVYFTLMFINFKPNVLTWWSDEYEYVSEARNFALFSKLETSFYSAKAVLYRNYPSLGYHPILYSFLMGLFLKIFRAAPWSTFLFNYILALLTILVMYLYTKERLEKKYIPYPLILIALFPLIVIYTNTQSPEVFFFFLISLIYYIYFKNKDKFNIVHFIILFLMAIAACQRFTYLILFILLIFSYYNWWKNRKILWIISSFLFYISCSYLLYRAFGSNTQLYPAIHEGSIYFHLKNYGIKNLFSKETFLLFLKYISLNLKKLIYLFSNPSSNYFLLHWLMLVIIVLNIVLFFKIKNKNLKKELSMILIPEIILIIATIMTYPLTDLEHFSHLRPFLGFIPLNLLFLFILLGRPKTKLRIVYLTVFILFILASSYFVYRPFYLKKIENDNLIIKNKVNNIENMLEKYRYKDSLTIAGIDDLEYPIRDYIVFNNHGDKFIRINQFELSKNELLEFTSKNYIDIWLDKEQNLWFTKMNNYFIKEHLNAFPYIFDVSIDENRWVILLKEEAFQKEFNFRTNSENFLNTWKSLNQCLLTVDNNQMVVYSYGRDPYFENVLPFNFGKKADYYIKITIIPPAPTYLQIFSRTNDTSYTEKKSSKFLVYNNKENTIISKISGNIIRIDPGVIEGKYIIKELSIYSFVD